MSAPFQTGMRGVYMSAPYYVICGSVYISSMYPIMLRIISDFPFQLVALTLAMCLGMKPRRYCGWRKALALIPLLLLYDAIAYRLVPPDARLRFLERPALLLPVAYLVVCVLFWYRCRWTEAAFCVIAAAISQNMIYNLDWMFQTVVRSYMYRTISVSFSMLVVMVLFVVFVLNRRFMADKTAAVNKVKLCVCSCTVLSMTAFFSPRLVGSADRMYVYLCYVLMDALALMFQFGMLYESNLEQRNAMMRQLLHLEQERHTMTKEMIEGINRRCHDLKHQIGLLKRMEPGKERDAYIRDMEEAVMIYGSCIRTGSETLDLILMEKMFLCRDRGIQLSCVSDGGGLDFIDPVDMYTLFGNALDNALESVVKAPVPRRIISLRIGRRGDFVSVHLENYMEESGTLRMAGGIPVTTKANPEYHGYGMMSMKHIVKRYGGELTLTVGEHLFCVDIVFPGRGRH